MAHDFEHRISTLDTGLFDLVRTQSTIKDRRSWLAVQRAVRESRSSFVLLEIGSYLGGSLQQYVQDPKCRLIYSIDNRTRDSRHAENSEHLMLQNLRRAAPAGVGKVVCFSVESCRVRVDEIHEAPDICFIDGEHTDEAVLADFAFCLEVCAPAATIVFHDAGPTRAGIRACLRSLERSGDAFVAYKLPGDTFVIALWGSPVGSDSRIRSMAVAVNGKRWLWTSRVSVIARQHVPDALRPWLASIRDRFWAH